MDAKRLEQFREKTREVKMLQRKIEKLEKQSKESVSDVVQASMDTFPYTRRSLKITGRDNRSHRRMMDLKDRLIKRRRELELEVEEIEAFIETVEDSGIRQILELRYIDGLKWREVSHEVYGYPSEELARIKLKRFLTK